MYQFFIREEDIAEEGIRVTKPEDVNHIKNVLRMKKGEEVLLCCSEKQKDYHCKIHDFEEGTILFDVIDIDGTNRELPVKITLFQGLPKGDKMELIIQKAVELGASRIVPVAMKRCVVKLDAKKAKKKVARWNTTALAAAKQSKRGIIPEVGDVISYEDALDEASEMDGILVPYEDAQGVAHSRQVISRVSSMRSVGIFIGPEGGFEPGEIDQAIARGASTITLGHRILRTETAGMTILSILMFALESDD